MRIIAIPKTFGKLRWSVPTLGIDAPSETAGGSSNVAPAVFSFNPAPGFAKMRTFPIIPGDKKGVPGGVACALCPPVS